VSERFEAPAARAPFPWSVLATYLIIFAGSLGATLLGAVVPLIGGVTDSAPLVASVAVALVAIEVVRRSQWRSTRYVVIDDAVVVRDRPLGLLGERDARALTLPGARLESGPDGPVLRRGPAALALTGLDRSTWEALAAAVRDGGGEVAEGFPPAPAQTPAPRDVPVRVIVGVALAWVALGGLSEWRRRREIDMAAGFVTLAGVVDTACRAAVATTQASVQQAWRDRLASHAGLGEARRQELLARGFVIVSHAGGEGGTADWSRSWDLQVATEALQEGVVQMDLRWIRARVCRPAALLVPAAARIDVGADDDPLARIVLDALCAQLDAAGATYTVGPISTP
jgi:hypothetical protein